MIGVDCLLCVKIMSRAYYVDSKYMFDVNLVSLGSVICELELDKEIKTNIL